MKKNKSQALIELNYNGHEIIQKDQMISLTDMWRARGCPKSQRPAQWLRLPETQKLIEFQKSNYVKITQLKKVEGKYGGTLATRKFALAYARYLSTEFYDWMLETIENHIDEMERRISLRSIKTTLLADPLTQEARITGKEDRLSETAELQLLVDYMKANNSQTGWKFVYSNFTKMTYRVLFNKIIELPDKGLRSVLSYKELRLLAIAEVIIGKTIKRAIAANVPYGDILKICEARLVSMVGDHGQMDIPPAYLIASQKTLDSQSARV